MSIKSFEEMTPEQQFAYTAGYAAAEDQIRTWKNTADWWRRLARIRDNYLQEVIDAARACHGHGPTGFAPRPGHCALCDALARVPARQDALDEVEA